ncbi:MAG: hypothetical protein HYY93_00490 [Planctomycetes bacterium]|nr:hypothetical protein [Planctomycetota bacterium]
MRGNALADPTVVGLLQPFMVTFWYGHPDDDPPAELLPYLRPGPDVRLAGGRSNVKALVMDADGTVVDAFDSMPDRARQGPFHESMPAWFEERLSMAREKLGIAPGKGSPRPLELPEAPKGERGIRVFVRLKDPGMPAYYAPVVEVATPTEADWKTMDHPDKARAVDASALKSAFKFMYPPGVMERQDKRTMIAWGVKDAEGTLTLSPAGSKGPERYALLKGKVRLTDEGPDGFSYEGDFEAVLTYAADKPEAVSLRGTYLAEYPRKDPKSDRPRRMPLVVAIESVP